MLQKNDVLIAYQIAFDVYDNATQEFLQNLLKTLPADEEAKSGTQDAMETDDKPEQKSTVSLMCCLFFIQATSLTQRRCDFFSI
jgi:hypothetical protein